ncbi:hypothetical protein CEXT_171851 [Caerostris extrusa]|uniref:Uncharacterized protein n=1 Tax=Caerostris extrusa TaxID=172846 RepID=A0AAV4V471_CAEEX|nr:hypothetical protein CEXT_171851 [Caerostris extrusa]
MFPSDGKASSRSRRNTSLKTCNSRRKYSFGDLESRSWRFCHWGTWGHHFGSEKGYLLASLHTQGDKEHISLPNSIIPPQE